MSTIPSPWGSGPGPASAWGGGPGLQDPFPAELHHRPGPAGRSDAALVRPARALLAALLGSLCPLLLLCGGLLLLPDSPLLLALALLLVWLSRHPAVIPTTAGETIGLGLILGLVTLGKYHAFLVLLSLLGWSLGSPDRRALVRRPWPALGWLIRLIVSAPLWLWNVQNVWVSFLFHGGRTDAVAGYALAAPPLFLLSQVALLFPTLGIVPLLALLPRFHLDGAAGPRQLLRWLVLPQLLVFTALTGRMHVLASWLAGLTRPRLRTWTLAAGWGTVLLLPPLLLTLSAQALGTVQPLVAGRSGHHDPADAPGQPATGPSAPSSRLEGSPGRRPDRRQPLRPAGLPVPGPGPEPRHGHHHLQPRREGLCLVAAGRGVPGKQGGALRHRQTGTAPPAGCLAALAGPR
ncbi:glycosyltransferase family 39 protein [Microcystis elabens FACHB-917]|nr:glycosyltransferase family 39 protein [Microcystis elabens FACHB-917]